MPPIPLPQALDLAMQFHRDGRLPEAEAIYRQILAVNPFHADALRLLGLIASHTGAHEQAVDLIHRAIAQNPREATFYNDLGNALQGLQRFEEACAAYRQALALQPDLVSAHNNLGNALKYQDRLDDAIAAYRRALELQPDLAEVHHNLANVLVDLGRLEEAVATFHRALHFQPAFPMAANNLGNALLSLHQVDDAIAAYRRALEIDPGFALAHNNLGNALKTNGRLDEAVASYREAIRLQPQLAMAQNNLGNALKDQGHLDEAVACFQRAIDADPTAADVHSNFLAVLHDRPETTLAQLFEAHCEYDRRHAAPLRTAWQPHANSRDPDRPLRLGFISSHFASHPVGRFLLRPLENLDRRLFEIICYSDSSRTDATTSRFQSVATAWRPVAGMSDPQLTELIRADGVDILFDLAGHTVANRLLVFARKPAPLQITWLDYVGTTGLAAMDYILADPRQIPPESARYYREKVLRLPDDYICYDPPTDAPDINTLPALDRGRITFGSFNTLAKISPQILGAWSRILQRIPASRLVLKNRGMDDPATVTRLRQSFGEHGVTSDRVELLGRSTPREVLASYQQIDIALDTFPYNGGLTTCEALWMGVPVITCHGEIFASRHGLTHLSAVGLTETIAHDLDDYIERAVALSQDLPHLATLRASLRDRVTVSPLCDGKKFAAHLATLLHQAWREWCSNPSG